MAVRRIAVRRIALVLGNGFDIFHGLPTKYTDFLSIMESYLSGRKEVRLNGNLFVLDKGIDSHNEIELKKCNTNIWYNYFQTIKQNNQLETWIDFENEIKDALISIDAELKKINSNKKDIKDWRSGHGFSSFYVTNPDKYISNTLGALKIYSGGVENNSNSYFLNEIFINKHSSGEFINFSTHKYIEFLYDQLKEFELIFKHYLLHFVEKITKNYKDIEKKWQNIDNGDVVNIFNFNYTNTISRYVDSANHAYLHGSIIQSNIIFGIVDIPNNINSSFKVFTKYYRRLLFQDFKDRQIVLNYPVDTIYIFGHSLDESDSKYILEFISNIKEGIIKMIVLYYSEADKATKILNLLKYIDTEIIEKLISKEILVFEKIIEKQGN
jgi:hypothetical protein